MNLIIRIKMKKNEMKNPLWYKFNVQKRDIWFDLRFWLWT